jgi:hypothetical protein
MTKKREPLDPQTFQCNTCSDYNTAKCLTCPVCDQRLLDEGTTYYAKELTNTYHGIINPRVQSEVNMFDRINDTSLRHPKKRQLREEAKEKGLLDELTIRQKQVFTDGCDTAIEYTEQQTADALGVSISTIEREVKKINEKFVAIDPAYAKKTKK